MAGPFVFELTVSYLKLLRRLSQFQPDLLSPAIAVDSQFQHVATVLLIHQAFQ